ncbi:hypothetical protein ACQY0O_005473 [Thecaphora frezii]
MDLYQTLSAPASPVPQPHRRHSDVSAAAIPEAVDKRRSQGSTASSSSDVAHRLLSPDDFKRIKAHLVLGPRALSRASIRDSPDIQRFIAPSSPLVHPSVDVAAADPAPLHNGPAQASSSSSSSSGGAPPTSRTAPASVAATRLSTIDSIVSKATFGPHTLPAMPRTGVDDAPRPSSDSFQYWEYAEQLDLPAGEASTAAKPRLRPAAATSPFTPAATTTAAAIGTTAPSQPSEQVLRPRTASSENLREEAAQAWANYRSLHRLSQTHPRTSCVVPDRTTSLSPTSLVLAALPKDRAPHRLSSINTSLEARVSGRQSASPSPEALLAAFGTLRPGTDDPRASWQPGSPGSVEVLESDSISPPASIESFRVPLLASCYLRTESGLARKGSLGNKMGGSSRVRRRSATTAALRRPTTRNDLTTDQRREQVRRMRKLAYLLGEESLQAVCWDVCLDDDDDEAPATPTAAAVNAPRPRSGRRTAPFPRLRRRGSFDSSTVTSGLSANALRLHPRRPSTVSSLSSLRGVDGSAALPAYRRNQPLHDQDHAPSGNDSNFLISHPNNPEDLVSAKAASILGIHHPAARADPMSFQDRPHRGAVPDDVVSLASVEVETAQADRTEPHDSEGRSGHGRNGDGNEGGGGKVEEGNVAVDDDDKEAAPRLMSVESGGFVVVKPDSLGAAAEPNDPLAERDSPGASREARRRRLAKMTRWLGETIPVDLVAPGSRSKLQDVAAACGLPEVERDAERDGFVSRRLPLPPAQQQQQSLHARRLQKLDKIFGATPPANLVLATTTAATRERSLPLPQRLDLLKARTSSASSVSEDEPWTPARYSVAESDVSTSTFFSTSPRHRGPVYLAPPPRRGGPAAVRRQRSTRSDLQVEGRSFISIDSSDSEAEDALDPTGSRPSLSHSSDSDVDPGLSPAEAAEGHRLDVDLTADVGVEPSAPPDAEARPSQAAVAAVSRDEVVCWRPDSQVPGSLTGGPLSPVSMMEPLLAASEDGHVSLRSFGTLSEDASILQAPLQQAEGSASLSGTRCSRLTDASHRHSRAFLFLDSDSEQSDGEDDDLDDDDDAERDARRATDSLDLARRDSLASLESLSDAELAAIRMQRLSKFFGRTPPPALPAPVLQALPPVPASTPASFSSRSRRGRRSRPTMLKATAAARAATTLKSLEEESLEDIGLTPSASASASSPLSASKRPSLFSAGAKWR